MNNEENFNPRDLFSLAIKNLRFSKDFDEDFVYKVYLDAYDKIQKFIEKTMGGASLYVNPLHLINLIISEYNYSLKNIDEGNKNKVLSDERYIGTFTRTICDKYIANFYLSPKNDAILSRYAPPISTLEMHVNYILRAFQIFKQNDPEHTLFVDILKKAFDLIKCIIRLITNGYETEAFSTWRTLHETECVILTLEKYGNPVIEAYLRHIRYGYAFRGLIKDKEENDAIFLEIKEGLKANGLKSKDMKRFIEYGWLYAIDKEKRGENFKINFGNGLETVSGLNDQSEIYQMASEVSHSSPLLIYSNPRFFLSMTVVKVYESFFRIEEIFNGIYCLNLKKDNLNNYLKLRERVLNDLKSIYKIEKHELIKIQHNS